MPLIHITQASDMNAERSAEVLRAVTEAYATAAGIPAAKVWAYITEVDREQWAVGGDTLAARDAAAARDRPRPDRM